MPNISFSFYLDGLWYGKWPYSCCFVGYCFQDLYKIACTNLVQFQSSFFFKHFIEVQVIQPYNIDMATTSKKSHSILSERYFHMVINLLIAVNAFSMLILTLFSVDEILLPRYLNCFTNFKGFLFWLKHIKSFLSEFI